MKEQSMGMMISSMRKEKGMTQADLAERMGVTDKAVSKWERDLSFPDISSIPTLAEIFGITVDELMQSKLTRVKPEKGLPIHHIIHLVLKALALAMGVAVVVLSAVGKLEGDTGFVLLGIGLASTGVCLLDKKDDDAE